MTTSQATTPPDAAGATALLHNLLRVDQSVRTRILELIGEERARWHQHGDEVAAPVDALAQMVLAGGKRLQPAFCQWAFVGAGGSPGDQLVVDAAAALELIHTSALIHDDVMDGSDRRRGMASVHARFSGEHGDHGWHGESRRFGEGVAILIGDLAIAYGDSLMANAPRPALDIYNQLRIEMCVGQYMDLLSAAGGSLDERRSRWIALYKSGRYTVERPLHLGAALAGRFDELAGPLSDYGLPLGEAFQLRDDLLGTFGDSSVTGKPVGHDLREGKPTLLLAIAARRGGPCATELLSRVGSPALGEPEIAALQRMLLDLGVKDELEARIGGLVAQAVAAAEAAPVTEDCRVALTELAVYIARRDH
jgi:geranylgeranyl diphosphate synthase type I